MTSQATSVEDYLASLPEDRREALEAIRQRILQNLPEGMEEGMQYGAIGYYVPHSVYPAGYHCDKKQPLPFAGLASQKNHMALYLFGVYMSPEDEQWFRESWLATGKKLDMGKSCVRFKKLEDVPLGVVGEAFSRRSTNEFVELYEKAIGDAKKK
jgi:hypothetical protein